MKIAQVSYNEFRKRLIKALNAWFESNVHDEVEEDFRLSNESFDSEIFDTLAYATTGYGFINSLKRVYGNEDIEANFENVLFDTTSDLYEDSIRGFRRVHDGKAIALGFLFGCDCDYPMNGLIFLSNDEEFCLYIPRNGNVYDSQNDCPYSSNEYCEDDLDYPDPDKMIADFEANVEL